MQAEAQRVVVPVPALSVSKRFGRFKDEDEKAVRVPQVAEDQVLKQLKEAWSRVQWKILGYFSEDECDLNLECLEAVKDIQYTAKDVEKFSIALVEFQDVELFRIKAGYFLSALISNCPESEFTIHTKHLEEKIEYLGLYNTKNITIDGDAGNVLGREMIGGRITVKGSTGNEAGLFIKNGEIVIEGDSGVHLGRGMKGGKITVEGNAGDVAGCDMRGGSMLIKGHTGVNIGLYMKGGKIIVKENAGDGVGINMGNGEIVIEGNCGEGLGRDMNGGKITVKGNAGKEVGQKMIRGEIRIEGDIVSLGERIQGGEIYHKGKLIFPKED
jgi:formylmethanofuran dehydrogenase subunit C